jgi:hypothetical protein
MRVLYPADALLVCTASYVFCFSFLLYRRQVRNPSVSHHGVVWTCGTLCYMVWSDVTNDAVCCLGCVSHLGVFYLQPSALPPLRVRWAAAATSLGKSPHRRRRTGTIVAAVARISSSRSSVAG